MDYKTLHGGGSLAASSRSMPGRNLAESARTLRAVLPNEASEALARVEDLLVEIAGCAPEELVEPGLEARELEQFRSSRGPVEVEAYLEHIRMKTAGLFRAACVAGGTLGGLSLRQIDALATYGQALGLAFQMSDDVMDLVGKPGLMGKGVGTDLAEGTVTLPIIFALKEGDAAVIRRALETPNPTPELLEAGIEAVLATNAIKRTEAWASGKVEAAIEGLTLLPDRAERVVLEAIASEVVGRDA